MRNLFTILAGGAVLAGVAGLALQPSTAVAPAPVLAQAAPGTAKQAAVEQTQVSGTESVTEAEIAKVIAGMDSPLASGDPTTILLDFAAQGSGSGIQPLQARGTRPAGWKPDPPLDLTGGMPSDADIRSAVTKAVTWLLDQQNENGSWDVVLDGTMLSETADQAVDAIAATALAGIALRYHVKSDAARIEPALKKAADFVMDRVYRGKLPLKVWYANWRYTLGLKFLHMEFVATSDADRKGEITAVCRRMVQAMLRLQLSNGAAKSLDKKRKARLSSRLKDAAMPTSLGVVLDLPTDQVYRGGAPIARILPGSAAEKAALAVGDKIVGAEGIRIENAVDFYGIETEWKGGQKINLKISRPGGKDFSRDVTLLQTWPGYVGLKVSAGTGEGPTIEGFLRFSPAKGELELGDVIQKVDGKEAKSLEDYRAIEAGILPGKKVKFEVLRGGKKKSATLPAGASPEGWYGFFIKEEDKGDENGVVVEGECVPGSAAEALGLKEGDRITWIGDVPILGLDHYDDFCGSVAAGKAVVLKWMRDGQEMTGEAVADAVVMPGDPQFDFTPTQQGWFGPAVISDIKKGGVSEKAGLKNGDVMESVDGKQANTLFAAIIQLRQLAAGDEVEIKVKRGAQTITAKFVLQKPPEDGGGKVEEGGWAYYPDMGESPSFSTASALLALYNVQKDILPGLKVALKDCYKSAENLITGLRVADPNNAGTETYIYRGGSKGMPGGIGEDLRGCQGRNAICELAMVIGGRRKTGDLKKMIELWQRYRGELDAVRRMEFYNPPNKGGSPHNFDRWFNAAYYWSYGHYHTLLAAKLVGGKTFKDINEICVKAVMKTRLEDGTWLDHPAFGKLVGTGLALWILGESEGPWKDGYGAVTTQDKTNPATPEKKPEE